LIALVGPTASGKSAAALEVAERLGLEIIGCDSVQVYRGLDIGTAKPSADERRRVRHHLIDVAEPDEVFSAARYAELADLAIADARSRGHGALIVGGTGLYLRALRFGLFSAPPRDEAVRARLRAVEAEGPGALHRRLAEVDPRAAARIQPRDLQRIIRALEVFELTGVPLSRHHASHVRTERHAITVVVLDPPLALLREKIVARTAAMLGAGLVDEVRALLRRYGPTLGPLSAVGYREVVAHLLHERSGAELAADITASTVRYARRQRTWFAKEVGAVRHAEAADFMTGALAGRFGSAL
jgi:tRNA dimethylallyltransferase